MVAPYMAMPEDGSVLAYGVKLDALRRNLVFRGSAGGGVKMAEGRIAGVSYSSVLEEKLIEKHGVVVGGVGGDVSLLQPSLIFKMNVLRFL